ncbi:hypothetical protein ACFL1Z_00675 [Thermodesulfobacteriota bacterium]
MIVEQRDPEKFDLDQPTDIEVALCLLRLLEEPCAVGRSSILGMAKNAMNSMTNPCAKKLLEDQITRH